MPNHYTDPRTGKQHEITADGTVKGLPIFKLGKTKGRNFDRKWWMNALELFQADAKENWFPPLILGHTNGFDGEKPRVGFFDNLREEAKVIYADFHFIIREAFDQFANDQWPGRSVEVADKFYATALLSVNPPYFKKFDGDFFQSTGNGEWINLDDDVDDVEKPAKEKGSENMDPTNEGLTQNQVNQIVAAEKAKFSDQLTAEFKEKYGMTPEEAIDAAKKAAADVEAIRKESAQSQITAFCERLSDMGVAKPVVDGYLRLRSALTTTETLKLDDKDVSIGEFADELVLQVINLASEKTLLVPMGEEAKVDDDDTKTTFPALDALKNKWADARPRGETGTKYDESSWELTVVAYELQEQAGGPDKLAFSDALKKADEKLKEIKSAS